MVRVKPPVIHPDYVEEAMKKLKLGHPDYEG